MHASVVTPAPICTNARLRFLEMYGDLPYHSRKACQKAKGKILSSRSILVYTDTGSWRHHIVILKDRMVPVIWDRKYRQVVAFLPPSALRDYTYSQGQLNTLGVFWESEVTYDLIRTLSYLPLVSKPATFEKDVTDFPAYALKAV